jgi:hypothetical protein
MIDLQMTGEKIGGVAVLLSGAPERLVLDVMALLLQEYPKVGGGAFQHAVACVRQRFRSSAAEALTETTLLISEMQRVGHLPKIRLTRRRSMQKDEVLLVALLAALQHGDRARAIEAAIALLDTGHVYGVLAAARSLAALMKEHGLLLRPVSAELFNYQVGYPTVADLGARQLERPAPEQPKRPVLRLLKSA